MKNDNDVYNEFARGLAAIAHDRKSWEPFRKTLIIDNIKALAGYKKVLANPDAIQKLEGILQPWLHKPNMHHAVSILQAIHIEFQNKTIGNPASSQEAESAENQDEPESVSAEEDADDGESSDAKAVARETTVITVLIGERIGISDFLEGIRNHRLVKPPMDKVSKAITSLRGGVFKFKLALSRLRNGWSESAQFALKKALDHTESNYLMIPVWLAIWLFFQALRRIISIMLLLSRPWTILEKVGLDPETVEQLNIG